ncbi:MAG: PAS domain S-box protein [Gammaproteobacteria bacterium]|nr:PAS domain S-box protein [Gammaproteobacteria bacterium]
MPNTLWLSTRWALVPILLGMIVSTIVIPDFRWNSELFHAMIESTGSLIGFGLAFVLMAAIQRDMLGGNYVWLIACFISMGTIDIFHSLQHPGQAFVWLHSSATFIGGLFAALIWLPAITSKELFKPGYFWVILFLAFTFSIVSIFWPDTTPAMLNEYQQFTRSAKFLNLMGGIGFLFAWLYFTREYHRLQQAQLAFFSNHFYLFGFAGLLFEFSALWDGNWWLWHVMRSFAYFLLIFHFATVYRRDLLISLQDSKHRYQTLVDTIPDWVWEVDNKGVYTYASPKVYDLLGYRVDEIIGKTPFDFMEPSEQARIGTIFNEIVAEKRHFRNLVNKNTHKSGKQIVLETSGVPILNKEGALLGYRGIDRDVTQRIQNESEVRKQRDFANTIFDVAGNLIIVLDLKGHIVRFNRAAEELTGYQSSEVIGKSVWGLLSPDKRKDSFKYVFENLCEGNPDISGQYESEWITRDGERRLLHWHDSILRDENGVISYIVAMGNDITDKIDAEIERVRMQSELQQAQQMESLGLLTGGIAHDFNNLLAVINGHAGLVLGKYIDNKDKLITCVSNIKEAGERASNLVSQMLAFSHMDAIEEQPIQLEVLINQDIKMLRATLPSTINIKSEIEPDLPDVMMNAPQFHQILMNLAINARDAMQESGDLAIRLGWIHGLQTQSPISHKAISGDWIELSVSDTGSGIEPDIQELIFNPFFTTKDVGKGTGMGLSVIYRIMENHGGHILLESELGKGSTFRMLFHARQEK